MTRRTLDQLIVIILAFVVSLLAARHLDPSPFDGYLIDTDSYERMARIEASIEAGRLLDAVPGDNGGEEIPLHWPHLLDVLVIAVAAPVSLALDWRGALHFAGALVGPASLAALAVASLFAARGIGGGHRFRLLPAILLLSSPSLIIYGYYGRVDHHTLLAFVAALTAALAIDAYRGDAGGRPAALAGLASAVGVWFSPEIIPFALMAWALAFLGDARSGERSGVRAIGFALSFTLVLAAAVAIDPPAAGRLAIELDRMSAAHVLLGALMSTAALAASWVPPLRSAWPAAIAAALPAILAVGAWAVAFPAVLGGVEGLQSQAGDARFVSLVQEMQSAYDLKRFVSFLLIPAIVLPVGVAVLLHRERSPMAAYAAVVAAVVLALAFTHVRFSIYAQVAGAVVAASLLERAMPPRGSRGTGRRIAAVAVVALVLLATPTVGTALLAGTDAGERRQSCDPRAAAPALDATAPGVVLAAVDYAPAILYFSDATIVAGPYHRAEERIMTVVDAFSERDFAGDEVPETVTRTGADYVLVCTHSGGSPETLHGALAQGDAPGWLEEIAIAPESGFRLYRLRD